MSSFKDYIINGDTAGFYDYIINGGDLSIDGEPIDKSILECLHMGRYEMLMMIVEGKVLQNETQKIRLMCIAVLGGHIKVVDYLIKQGFNVNNESMLLCPMTVCCITDDVEIAQLLLDNGASIDKTDTENNNYLFVAAASGSIDMIRFLLSNGLDVNILNNQGRNVMFEDINRSDVFIALYEAGARLDIIDDEGDSAIDFHSAKSFDYANIDLICFMMDNGGTYRGELELSHAYGNSSFVDSVVYNDIFSLKSHIQENEDIELATDSGTTLLMRAIHLGNLAAFKMLISSGANYEAKNDAGRKCLHLSCINTDSTMTEIILEHDNTLNEIDNEGKTPLFVASERKNHKSLIAMINAGCDVNAIDNEGNTPLHAACIYGQYKNVKILLDAGANMYTINSIGYTPAHSCCIHSSYRCLNILIQAGLDTNIIDSKNRTPLELLAGMNTINTDLMSLLIDAECEIRFNVLNKLDNFRMVLSYIEMKLNGRDKVPSLLVC